MVPTGVLVPPRDGESTGYKNIANRSKHPLAQGRPGRKREREFLTLLKWSFLERGAYFYKIPDMPHFEGAKFRFDIPKPFDAFGGFAGQAFAVEAKVISRFKNFTLKDLRPCQIEGLEAWRRAGGKSYVFIMLWQQGRTHMGMSLIKRLYVFKWERLKANGRISKAEMVASPHMPFYRVKTPEGKVLHRFNVDEFLISLIMD